MSKKQDLIIDIHDIITLYNINKNNECKINGLMSNLYTECDSVTPNPDNIIGKSIKINGKHCTGYIYAIIDDHWFAKINITENEFDNLMMDLREQVCTREVIG